MIKFARVQATSADNSELVQSALAFVQGGEAVKLSELPHVTFAHPWLLLLLLALPLVALFEGGVGAAPAVIYSSLRAVLSLGKARRSKMGGWLTSLLLFALALLIVALARPQLGSTISQVQASGIDIMLALDVSGSMIARTLPSAANGPAAWKWSSKSRRNSSTAGPMTASA